MMGIDWVFAMTETEVRFQVDDAFLKALKEKLGGSTSSTDVARDALTLLNWAVGEKVAGRDIASAKDGNIHAKLVMPSLERLQKG